jgi:hypothetical protein
MQYTIGELIDRLIITLLKQWHIEEDIANTEDDEQLGILSQRSDDLNTYRNKLVAAIDERFNEEKRF